MTPPIDYYSGASGRKIIMVLSLPLVKGRLGGVDNYLAER